MRTTRLEARVAAGVAGEGLARPAGGLANMIQSCTIAAALMLAIAPRPLRQRHPPWQHGLVNSGRFRSWTIAKDPAIRISITLTPPIRLGSANPWLPQLQAMRSSWFSCPGTGNVCIGLAIQVIGA